MLLLIRYIESEGVVNFSVLFIHSNTMTLLKWFLQVKVNLFANKSRHMYAIYLFMRIYFLALRGPVVDFARGPGKIEPVLATSIHTLENWQ
jgi:hypothetical protein